jgi:hypothetical protein
MMINSTVSKKTNVLKVQWEGEYSKFNDQFGRSVTEVNLTKNVFVPKGVSRVIIDLSYDPVDASEMSVSDITYTIDYNNDGNVDETGGMEPVLSGNRHEEIDVGDSETGSLWAFGIVGQATKMQNPARDNSYVEVRIEYIMSVQFILDAMEEEPHYIDFSQDNSMIAPLRFGSPAPGYKGGEVAMTLNFYDLDAVEYKEVVKEPSKAKKDPPYFLLIFALAAVGVLVYFIRRRKDGLFN